jgi:hypothetical protein
MAAWRSLSLYVKGGYTAAGYAGELRFVISVARLAAKRPAWFDHETAVALIFAVFFSQSASRVHCGASIEICVTT